MFMLNICVGVNSPQVSIFGRYMLRSTNHDAWFSKHHLQQQAYVDSTIHECLKTHLSPFHPLWSKQVVLTGCADWTCYGFSTLECVTEVWEAFRCHWDCTLSLFSYENGSI